jgi:subtilisin family serine protease
VLNDLSVSSAGVEASARSLAAQHGASVARTYQHALRGFEAHMSEASARKLAADPSVRYVTQNHTVQISGTQAPTPSWGLDRVDQRALPLNNSYTYPTTASNVRAYIIDTGINFSHSDFGGRAVSGRDTVDNDNDATDCQGHGSHVSGTVGGSSYGLAKSVTLVGVRVLNCSGSGTYAGVIAGIDWVTADHLAGQPAVANMSLGGGASAALDSAVSRSIADGVSYAVAAGNGNAQGTPQNACNSSPARVTAALTVGATDRTDKPASFSNYGSCVDLFAPGVSITSDWYTTAAAINTISGTSMATPHVAGVAALYLQGNRTATPATVATALKAATTKDAVPTTRTANNDLLFSNY